jgi:hypothetical protein
MPYKVRLGAATARHTDVVALAEGGHAAPHR